MAYTRPIFLITFLIISAKADPQVALSSTSTIQSIEMPIGSKEREPCVDRCIPFKPFPLGK